MKEVGNKIFIKFTKDIAEITKVFKDGSVQAVGQKRIIPYNVPVSYIQEINGCLVSTFTPGR